MGNTVNTAARLMDYANEFQIMANQQVYEKIKQDEEILENFDIQVHENISLKGRSVQLNIYEIIEKEDR